MTQESILLYIYTLGKLSQKKWTSQFFGRNYLRNTKLFQGQDEKNTVKRSLKIRKQTTSQKLERLLSPFSLSFYVFSG